jgi:hypothetical protein
MSDYSAVVLSSPYLVLYWKLDDLAGTTCLDHGPSGLDGTYVNGPTLGQPPLADGTSVLFAAASTQGVENYAGLGSLPIQANGKMAIEAWVHNLAVGSVIAWSDTSTAGGRFFQLSSDATGLLRYAMFGEDATGHTLRSVTNICDGATHYVAANFDGTTMEVFIDSPVADNSVVPAMGGFPLSSHNHGFWAGFGYDGIAPYLFPADGTIDEVALYTGPLTGPDITNRINPPSTHDIYAAVRY